MWAIFRKEISTYFASMVGYLAIGIFLILNALMFWVFPSTSVLDSGYAQLDGFFQLTPYLFLFLIPAVTMKAFAAEKQEGTLDWLRTAPVSSAEIVLGKYFASLAIGCLALLPTISYVISVYYLALPQGNIDFGGIIGSYLGLFFLAAAFTAIGIWASMYFQNTIVSFLSAIAVIFFFYYGFGAIGQYVALDPLHGIVAFLDMDYHYGALSRGVMDSRSVIYLVSVSALFLYLAQSKLRSEWLPKSKRSATNLISLIIFLISLQIGGLRINGRLDFTADKRFSLTELSETTVGQLTPHLSVQILLEGNVHPGFKRLQASIRDFLRDLQDAGNQDIQVEWVSPLRSDSLDRSEVVQQLANRGIQPVQVHVEEDDAQIQKLLFPYAILQMDGREQIVNLLPSQHSDSYEETINRGIELLEYSFISAIRKLQSGDKPVVAFAQGHGEADPNALKDASHTLAQGFRVAFLDMTTVKPDDLSKIDLLILAKPTQRFSEEVKFKLDHVVMQGGKLIVAVDQLDGSLDSLKKTGTQNVLARALNLDDLFFTYGFRLNYDLVADLQATQIPVTTSSNNANGQQLDLATWPFHPLVTSLAAGHPVFKKTDPVKLEYAGTIDTVAVPGVQKHFVLHSSAFNQVFVPPVPISLGLLNDLPSPEELRQEPKPLALLLEGQFPSAYRFREKPVSLPAGVDYRDISEPNQIFVIADGDVFSNKVNVSDQSTYPLGWDPITRQAFANKTLLLNLVDYMLDGPELISLRNKEIKLRLLNKVAVKKSRIFWQSVHVVLPLIILAICAALQHSLRKRKWGFAAPTP